MALLDKFDSRRASGGRPRGLLDSIVQNLENILNTRREYGSPLPDFGIRPLTEYVSRDDIAIAVMREVKDAIERYEPRLELREIAMQADAGPFRLSFVIKAAIRKEAQTLEVSFDTVFNNFAVDRR
jgi:type VI secretion system lysozyme-like protein